MSGFRGAYPQRDYRGNVPAHGMGYVQQVPMMQRPVQGGYGAPMGMRDVRGGGGYPPRGQDPRDRMPVRSDPRDRRDLDRRGPPPMSARSQPSSAYQPRAAPPRRDGGKGASSASPTPGRVVTPPPAGAKDAKATEAVPTKTASASPEPARISAEAVAAEEAMMEEAARCPPAATCSALVTCAQGSLLLLGDDGGMLSVVAVGAPGQRVYRVPMNGEVADILSTETAVYVAVGAAVEVYITSAVYSAVAACDEACPDDGRVAQPLALTPASLLPLPDKDHVAVSLAFGPGGVLSVGDSAGQLWRFCPEGAGFAAPDGPLELHRTSVTGIAFADDCMVTASHDGTLLFSPFHDDALPAQLVPCVLEDSADKHMLACAVNCIDVDSDKLWLAVGGAVPYVSLVCLTTRRVRRVIPLPCASWHVKSIKFRKADVLVGVDAGYVLTYSLSGKLLGLRETACDTVQTIAVSDSGLWAVSGSNTNAELYR
eukprot:TRINITY_DN25095_c0_g1_i1.p2 TRINITY_DN25095_c0_g1~~TRINITY_DN25095_c0_g1_i1.p2  ORF type:complete len:484 (+),score=129.35 TRINITY_DN25095_c0_g1_i1:45-1496(+)